MSFDNAGPLPDICNFNQTFLDTSSHHIDGPLPQIVEDCYPLPKDPTPKKPKNAKKPSEHPKKRKRELEIHFKLQHGDFIAIKNTGPLRVCYIIEFEITCPLSSLSSIQSGERALESVRVIRAKNRFQVAYLC
jgi:hypothetical protein